MRHWLWVALACSGCGYVGDPLPPALNIPQRIADLKAIEAGDRIEVEFTLPQLTTEGLVLRTLGGVDLRAGVASDPFNAEQWADKAKTIEMSSEQPGPVKKVLQAKEWAGKDIVIGVRALNSRGRTSGWSNFVKLHVIEPLAKPVLRAMSDAQGAKLEWSGGSEGSAMYRVFRKADAEEEPKQIAEVGAKEYTDRAAEYGTKFVYSVVALSGEVQSDRSEPVTLTPVDSFPPSVPEGVKAIAGVSTVELVWDRVPEADLRGYRVYRSVDQGPFERVAELVDVPSFSDKALGAARKCAYAISALDVRGNESGRSAAVEVALQ